MSKYLIVKCNELDDQWECDADRIPMYITDNWKKNIPTYKFEVWEIKSDNILECVREYDEVKEEGTCFGYYENNPDDVDNFIVIKKWPDKRYDSASHWDFITQYFSSIGYDRMNDDLREDEYCFYWNMDEEQRLYCYCEYKDRYYRTGV